MSDERIRYIVRSEFFNRDMLNIMFSEDISTIISKKINNTVPHMIRKEIDKSFSKRFDSKFNQKIADIFMDKNSKFGGVIEQIHDDIKSNATRIINNISDNDQVMNTHLDRIKYNSDKVLDEFRSKYRQEAAERNREIISLKSKTNNIIVCGGIYVFATMCAGIAYIASK